MTRLERARRSFRKAVRQALRPDPPAGGLASPAAYKSWRAGETAAGEVFPQEWLAHPDLPIRSGARMAAVVHVYHPELLDELVGQLASITVPFDLLVTNASGRHLALDTARLPQVRGSVVLDVENRGRDLWPLAQLVNAGLIDGYELVVKVHTKRSDWRASHAALAGTGGSWRSDLLAAVLGDASNVATILAAFEANADLGTVTADGSVLGPSFWGQNAPVTVTLLRRLGLDLEPSALRFAAGSMYWTRASILRRFAALRLTAADFEDEAGQIDGTTAHALERVIGILAADASLRVLQRSDVPGTRAAT